MYFIDGTLYTVDGDQEIFLGNGCVATELETSAQETLSNTYTLTRSASAELEVNYLNTDLFDNMFGMQPADTFTIEYSVPIMIQARWHHKPRIRKKWLKRYGMKKDTIKVKANAMSLEYYPGHVLDDLNYYCAACTECCSYSFEAEKCEYVFRPHQLRKDIKIEL